jgi:hypothetical protein
MYGIIVFKHDWADEFDASGFKLLNPQECEQFNKVKDLPDWKKWDINFSFGTNEGFEEGEIKGKDLILQEITLEEFYQFRAIFNLGTLNHFGQCPYIMDEVLNFIEEIEWMMDKKLE